MKKEISNISVAILAGGLATRLRPITLETPKSLVEVAGKAFLEHQIELLRNQGLKHIVLCLGHLNKKIVEKFGDGSKFGVKIDYSFDGTELLGTGGAIKKALPLLGEKFFVLYGDSYLTVPFYPIENYFNISKKNGLMTVFNNNNLHDKSNIVFRNKKIVEYDKKKSSPNMNHIDYGLSLFHNSVFRDWPMNRSFDISEVIKKLIKQDDLAGYEVKERFYEMGSKEGLVELENLLKMTNFSKKFLDEAKQVIDKLDTKSIEKAISILANIRKNNGRLFILGVGGSAANASHAVNDFRKICNFECYAPTDNVSELTARTNDDGWASVFVEWIKVSKLKPKDALLILSVGGGNIEKNVSPNLVNIIKYAKEIGTSVIGIVGRDGGYTATVADACVIIPIINPDLITPFSESFQAVVWHLFVSHPKLKVTETKWESVK